MPRGKAVPSFLVALLGWAAAACASTPVSAPVDFSSPGVGTEAVAPTARMPREIQLGAVDMVIQRVEPEVSRGEVAAAIAPLIANAPVCLRWPTIWMEAARRNTFVARYDLMIRDWGQPAASAAEARMEEFVEMGLLQKQAGANPQVVTYALTETGLDYLNGIIEPGRRRSFCGPAERRLVAITAMEWGQYPCGTLRVRFTHDGEAWPSWVRSEATRARLAQAWPAAGAALDGSVSLSRQWFRRSNLPPGVQNGGLRSACYDPRRQEIVGDDLSLSIGAID